MPEVVARSETEGGNSAAKPTDLAEAAAEQEYNIAKTADPEAFEKACALIEAGIKKLSKEELLEDVDGTQIQIYTTPEGKIKVFNDYEVDAVYADSDFDLEREISLVFFQPSERIIDCCKSGDE